MTASAPTSNNDTTVGRTKRSLAHRLLRWFALAVALFLLLLAGVVAYSDSTHFKDLLRQIITDATESALNAQLHIGDINGSLFSGWVLSDVALSDSTGTIVSVEAIIIRYNLLTLPLKRITVEELTLRRPVISVTRAEGRDWNVSNLIRETDDPDTTAGEFDWEIDVGNLRLLDSRIAIFDSTTPAPESFDLEHLDLDHVNIALRAFYSTEEARLGIDRFSFESPRGGVALRTMSGDITLSESGSRIEKLSVVTARSRLSLSAEVEQVNILEGIDTDLLGERQFALELYAPAVDVRDVQYFLPALDFLGGEYALLVKGRGSLNDLAVEKLDIEATDSHLIFSGRLQRILDGSRMWLDVSSEYAYFEGDDVPVVLPGIPMLDLSGVGSAEATSMTFRGEPLNFKASMDMTSDAGDAVGTVALDLRGEDMTYKADLKVRRGNLGAVLLDPAFASHLNVRMKAEGRGFRFGSMNGSFTLRADSSRFNTVMADGFEGLINVREDSLGFDLDASRGGGRLLANGGLGFTGDSITGFSLNATAHELDLERLLGDSAMASDLNLTMVARGNSIALSDASMQSTVMLLPSRYGDLILDTDTFSVTLEQDDPEQRLLALESRYADANIIGRFDIPAFLAYLRLQGDSLNTAFAGRMRLAPDSTLGAAETESASPDSARFMNARYELALKEPERIAKYLDASTFILKGTWDGSIIGGVNGMDINGRLRVSDLYLVTPERALLAAGVQCTYDVRSLSPYDPFGKLVVKSSIAISDLYADGLSLSRTMLGVDYKNDILSLRLKSMVDTTLQADMTGDFRFDDGRIAAEFDQFRIAYLGYPWVNRKPVKVFIDSGGYVIDQFLLRRDAMQLSISGRRSFEGDNSFTMYADSLDVGFVQYLMTQNRDALDGGQFHGTGFVEANFQGSDGSPLFAVDTYIDNLGYQDSDFGTMLIEARYSPGELELYSRLQHEQDEGTSNDVFFLSGIIPMTLSFAGDEAEGSLATEEPAEREGDANLRVQMQDLPLPLVENFIGLFSPLYGVANADILLKGTATNPEYSGYLKVENANGRFLFNNMTYNMALDLQAEGREFTVRNAVIRNIEKDWPDGTMTASGRITTESFSIDEFDLTMNGQLKVLRSASRSALQSIYGDLYVATDADGLSYTGRIDRSLFHGNIIVQRGELVIPSEVSEVGAKEYTDIMYVVVDDTTREKWSSLSGGRIGQGSLLGSELEQAGQEQKKPRGSLIDGLTYDLTLSTKGRLRVELPFSLTKEVLNATLDISNLKVNNWGGGGGKFVGAVQLANGSDMVFFGKRLEATGQLLFTRDPMNPDLDLEAVYTEYYSSPRNESRRRVYVIILVTGTKEQPNIAFDLRWDERDGEPVSRSGEADADAVSFMLFGMFPRDINSQDTQDRSSIAEKTPELANALGSSLASNAVNQFIGRAGLQDVIKRIEFANLGTQDTRVQVTTEIGQAIVTYDGQVNNLASSNVSLDFPIENILGLPWANFIFRFTRRTVDDFSQGSQQAQENYIHEFKILQRISF